jgi:hypothetical protein
MTQETELHELMKAQYEIEALREQSEVRMRWIQFLGGVLLGHIVSHFF